MTIEITLPFTSRYKRTNIYSKNGRVFFGLWKPPTIPLDGDEKEVVITKAREGSLSLLAFAEYNSGDLDWVIALANGIRNIPEEVVAGLRVKIPKQKYVNAALLES